MEIISEAKAHGGRQLVAKHLSASTDTDMTFSIFLPPQAEQGKEDPQVVGIGGERVAHVKLRLPLWR